MQTQVKLKNKRRFGKTVSEHWQMFLMVTPTTVLLFLFSYMPMFGTVIAFKRYKVLHIKNTLVRSLGTRT